MEKEEIIVLFLTLLFIFIICLMCYKAIRHSSGSYIKVGEIYRKFDNNDVMVENPYEINYTDYEVLKITNGFCLVKNLINKTQRSFELEMLSFGSKLIKTV